MTAVRVIRAGESFSRLTVIADRTEGGTKIQCRCSCGNLTTVEIGKWAQTESCGCLRIERTRLANTTHGHSKTPTYRTWVEMWRRCTNPQFKHFKDYGGRGIAVCDRWKAFENFLADMGERPEGLSLDRINNDGYYEPSNCRWATVSEQNSNQRPRKLKPRLSCSRGHTFTDDTTRVTTQDHRRCVACEQAYQDGYRAGLRAAQKGAAA